MGSQVETVQPYSTENFYHKAPPLANPVVEAYQVGEGLRFGSAENDGARNGECRP
jgi:hypothetical protein